MCIVLSAEIVMWGFSGKIMSLRKIIKRLLIMYHCITIKCVANKRLRRTERERERERESELFPKCSFRKAVNESPVSLHLHPCLRL